MASVVSELPLHGLGLYPWHRWLDGQAWELRRGEDFRCSLESFRSTCNRTARERGCRVMTRKRGDVLTIQAVWPAGHAVELAKRIREAKQCQ